MDERPDKLLNLLQAAVADLLWLSEIDAPFEVVYWQTPATTDLSSGSLLLLTHQPAKTPVKVLTVDDFFAGAIEEQDWFGEEERVIAARYGELVALLKQKLTNLTVYQVGAVNLDLYIVGKFSPDGIIGLTTKALET